MGDHRAFQTTHPQVRIEQDVYNRLKATAQREGISIARKLSEYIEWGLETENTNHHKHRQNHNNKVRSP